MKGTTIVCPHCKRHLSVPPEAVGKSLECGHCGGAIATLHPHAPPSTDVVLERQDDVLVDYHDRLVELYERTTPLIEAVRARRAGAEAAISDALESEKRRILYLVESAKTQLTAIVNAAERAAPRVKFATRFPNKIRCPHCRRTVCYKDRAAGMSLRCPNPNCGLPIAIPSLDEGFWQAVNQFDGGEGQ
jgi:hypothetical protein